MERMPLVVAAVLCSPLMLSLSLTPARRQLFVDPELIAFSSGVVGPSLANVSKESSNPVLVASREWETWTSYVSVVPANLVGPGGGTGLAFYYNNVMCCNTLNGDQSACVGKQPGGTNFNRTLLVCDDPRNLRNVTGTSGNPQLSATLRAESKDGLVWTKPSLHQVLYNGSTANNVVALHQLIPGLSDGRGVFHDTYDRDPTRRYKMAGVFNRAPAPPHLSAATSLDTAAPPGYVQDPVPCIPAGKCITDIRHSTVAAGAAKCNSLPSCSSFSYYAATGWVQLFDINHTESCLPNPPWISYRKASLPAPPVPSPLAQYPGYHFGTMSSRDGITWSNFTDISYQLRARADTSNNAVFDESTGEWMIFTRIDCHYAPFSTNPSLNGTCGTDGMGGDRGLRRSARSVSKSWGPGAKWSVATDVSHGTAGYEQYTLNPWRDPAWRPGLWFGLASFYHTATGVVQCELLVSSDHGASWKRLAPPATSFVPRGQAGSWDSMGVYAGAPIVDPWSSERLLIYYEGVNVPHDQSPGHTRYGLAYSPKIPAGLRIAGAGQIRTREVLIQAVRDKALQMTVEGNARALKDMQIVAYSTTNASWSAEALHFEDIPSVQPLHSTRMDTAVVRKRVVTTWRQRGKTNHGGMLDSSDLKQLVGESVSLSFKLPHGGVLYSFGFESLH